MTDPIVVLRARAGPEEGVRLARRLVEPRLAACVNLIVGVKSVYRRQGAVEEADDMLLVIKSSRARIPELRDAIQRLHSYAIPEIVALPVTAGSQNYLKWLGEQLQ